MVKKDYKNTNGYTLIETMIAVSLFVIIVTAGMGALLNANLLYQKSHSMRSILDSLNFVMEDMGRNMRTGYNFRCFGNSQSIDSNLNDPRSCASGWAIAFESQSGTPGTGSQNTNDQWIYYLSGTAIYKSTDGGVSYVQLTPPEVRLQNVYAFSVLGAEPESAGDKQQPLITIRLNGDVIFRDTVTPFSLQTSVSERALDYGN